MSETLSIKNLHASVSDENQQHKAILNGVNLEIKAGEVHVIMGPNGSGKSTLANILAGREGYQVEGEMRFAGHDLLPLTPEARAHLGVFLAFQYPTEIPGVNNLYFLRSAVNSLRAHRGQPLLDAADFMQWVKNTIKNVGLPEGLLRRAVNEGFSGGEKKRNELLQLLLLAPKLIILDETDSGLDIDALQMLASCINESKKENRCVLIVTHYQRLLDYIQPDRIHVMAEGKILQSGDASLAHTLEKKGYAWLVKSEVDHANH